MTNGNTTEADDIQVQQAERIAALEKLVAQLSLDKLMLASTITVLERRGESVKKKTGTKSSRKR